MTVWTIKPIKSNDAPMTYTHKGMAIEKTQAYCNRTGNQARMERNGTPCKHFFPDGLTTEERIRKAVLEHREENHPYFRMTIQDIEELAALRNKQVTR